MTTMTTNQLIALLQEWPADTPVTLASQEYVIGDPVAFLHEDGSTVVLPDALYIGVLSDRAAECLGWRP